MVTEENDLEALKLLYTENGNFNRYLIDWRHKVMTRFFVTVAALVVIAKWISENPGIVNPKFTALPFLLASAASLAFLAMDHRNHQLMNACVKVGAQLEKKISANSPGYFMTVSSIKRTPVTYTTMLNLIYGTSSILFLFLGGYVLSAM